MALNFFFFSPILAVEQGNEFIEVITEVNGPEIAVGECATITYSVIFDLDFKLRYHLLDSSILLFNKNSKSFDCSYFFQKIISGNNTSIIEHKGRKMNKVKMYSITFCPIGPKEFEIIPIQFCFLKGEKEVEICFWSEPAEIKVKPFEANGFNNSNFHDRNLIGDFEVMETIEAENYTQNGVFNYTLEISGYGDLFNFDIQNYSDEFIDIIVLKRKFQYDFFYNNYWSKREFEIQIIPKKPSRLRLSSYFKWNALSRETGLPYDFNAKKIINVNRIYGRDKIGSKPADIVIALDISTSMLVKDLGVSRYNAAIKIVNNISSRRNVEILAYNGEVFKLNSNRDESIIYTLFNQGTAIGNAILESMKYLESSKSPDKFIILIGDGVESSGNVRAISAATLAMSKGIKIHTIGVGNIENLRNGKAFYTGQDNLNNSVDFQTLEEVSRLTGGNFQILSDISDVEELIQTILEN